MKIHNRFIWALAFALFASVSAKSDAQEGAAKKATPDDQTLITQVYRVKDLVVPTTNYAFRGVQLPGADDGSTSNTMPGFGGMSPGGMGGGMSGGMFNVSDHVLQQSGTGLGGAGGGFGAMPPAPQKTFPKFQITFDDLIVTITSAIEPSTWEDTGGPGSIASLGGLLVVQQTPLVHNKIADLLSTLRKEGAAPKSMTIRAYWLALESSAVNGLRGAKTIPENLDKNIVARGQITCFDGQTVHMVAGNLKSGIIGVTPVVGQIANPNETEFALAAESNSSSDVLSKPEENERVSYLAQFQGSALDIPGSVLSSQRSVGYKPITQAVNVGAMLQVTAILASDGKTVAVDVHNIVVGPAANSAEPLNRKNGIDLDRINVTAQQFRTTLRMKIDETKVVGGMSLQPTTNDKDEQLYLLLEVSPDA